MRKLLVVLAVFGLFLAACGGDDDDDTTAAGATGDDTEETAAATVSLRETPLGDVLVDSEGMTLYLFTRDVENKSNCADACAATWPPLGASGDLAGGDGVDDSKLSSIDRADGSKQVAYAGKPLYYYAPDEKAGDTKGQGVGGVWFVLGADGEAITSTESSAPAGISY